MRYLFSMSLNSFCITGDVICLLFFSITFGSSNFSTYKNTILSIQLYETSRPYGSLLSSSTIKHQSSSINHNADVLIGVTSGQVKFGVKRLSLFDLSYSHCISMDHVWQPHPWGFVPNFSRGFEEFKFGNYNSSRILASGNPHSRIFKSGLS